MRVCVCAAMLLGALLVVRPGFAQEGGPTAAPAERAAALEAAGRLEDALAVWRAARAADPEDDAARRGLARAHALVGAARLEAVDPRGARAHLVIAAALAPEVAQWRYLHALASHRSDEPAEAIAEVEAAIALKPSYADAHALLGRLEYEAGRFERAVASLERALAADPGHHQAKALLAKVRREAEIERDLAVLWTNHFRMRFTERADLRALAERIGKELEDAYSDIGATLGIYPRGEVAVLLYSEADFKAVTGSHGWVAALYDGKIRIPVGPDLLGDRAALRALVRHEYVHALVASRTRTCPTWLHEGLAQHFEGRGEDREALARLAAAEVLPQVRKLDGAFTAIGERDRVEVVYAGSLGFVRFLLRLRGPVELAAVITALGEGRSLDEALERSYGEGLDALDVRWREALKDR